MRELKLENEIVCVCGIVFLNVKGRPYNRLQKNQSSIYIFPMDIHSLPRFLHLCMDDRHFGYKQKWLKRQVTGERAYRSGTPPAVCLAVYLG
jgi:hypothetical protein